MSGLRFQEGGLRLRRNKKRSLSGKPLISVVTVCLNSGKVILPTIKSVLNQDYGRIEYIVIDGASSDNTIRLIERYEDKIDYWRSEKDKGIYDAMNKAVRLARGDYIIFMNAGDTFTNKRAVSRTFSSVVNYDMIFGDCRVRYGSSRYRTVKAGNIDQIWKGMVFSHQSLFASRSLLKKFQFKTGTLVSDYEFTVQCIKQGAEFCYVPRAFSTVMAGGIADYKAIDVVKGWWSISRKYFPSFLHDIYFIFVYLLTVFLVWTRRIIPESAYARLVKSFWRM